MPGGPSPLMDAKGWLAPRHDLLGNWDVLYFGCTSTLTFGLSEFQKWSRLFVQEESKQNFKVLIVLVIIDPLMTFLHNYVLGFKMALGYRVFFKKVEEIGSYCLVESSRNIYLMIDDPNTEVTRCFAAEYNAEELS